MPFESLSAEPDNEYIALGMADSVLHRLASLPELIVIARSSSFALGKPAPDARDAGHRLGARYLVEGSVQRAGKALRVNAQLIDTTTNNELWSLKIDRTIDDVFAVQDQIAQRVAQQLDVTLHGRSAEYADLGTDAYLAFLKGRALIAVSQGGGYRGVDSPVFSRDRVGALIRRGMGRIGQREDYCWCPCMILPAKTPASYGPRSKRSWIGRLRSIRPPASRISCVGCTNSTRAMIRVARKPTFAKASISRQILGLGCASSPSFCSSRERYDETLTVIDRARLVDPLSAENHYRKGEVLRVGLRGNEDAAALYLQALAVKPDFYPAYTRLAQVRWNQGRIAEAIKYGERSVAIEPHVDWTRARLVWFYVDVGDLSAARDVVRGFAPGAPDTPLEEALICFRAGNLERAEALARKGLNDPDVNDGLAIILATDAIVERAIAMRAPASARQFILVSLDLKKDRGTAAVVSDNFPQVLQLATLEHFVGNRALGDDLADRILTFTEQGGTVGVAGREEWTRAVASALLGHNDAALDHLEKMIPLGGRVGWWVRLDRDPSFAALRATPRFQAIAADTRSWLQSQLQLLAQMRMLGEVPPRSAAAQPGGC